MYEKEGNALTQIHGNDYWPMSITLSNWTLCHRDIPTCFIATVLLVKATEEIVVVAPLTICVPQSVESPLNSYHRQHFGVSHLTFYEILLLTIPHISLSCCNNLNPADLLPSFPKEVRQDSLKLVDRLLIFYNDLWKIPLTNPDILWLTEGSYLKGDHGKYCAGYAISTPLGVIEIIPLPLAIMAQQAELYALTQACTLAKGKATNMLTEAMLLE